MKRATHALTTHGTHRTDATPRWPAVLLLFAAILTAACASLPGSRTQQSTAVGAATGAAVGAVVAGEGNRLGGALLGAVAGAAGGYLIGARTSWFERGDGREQALDAVSAARRDPATAAEARSASTADINADGFVTLDEIVAMERAGFDDSEMLARLRATGQVFEVNDDQEAALVAEGVSPTVIAQMQRINQGEKTRVLGRANLD
jgi:hypothetical protein